MSDDSEKVTRTDGDPRIYARLRLEQYDQEHANPRDADNVTLLYCWHPDYVLGDEQFKSPDGSRGAIDRHAKFPICSFDSMDEVAEYLRTERGAVGPIMPLFLYDHSGITISVSDPSRSYDPGGWDTTMVGFACVTEERLMVCCGEGAEYRTDEWVEKAIRDDVAEYDLYVRGEVYWYEICDSDGNTVESLSGLLGYEWAMKDLLIELDGYSEEQLAKVEADRVAVRLAEASRLAESVGAKVVTS